MIADRRPQTQFDEDKTSIFERLWRSQSAIQAKQKASCFRGSRSGTKSGQQMQAVQRGFASTLAEEGAAIEHRLVNVLASVQQQMIWLVFSFLGEKGDQARHDRRTPG